MSLCISTSLIGLPRISRGSRVENQPISSLIGVDFPAPFGPMKPKHLAHFHLHIEGLRAMFFFSAGIQTDIPSSDFQFQSRKPLMG